ncbi:unnamed protein product [Prunus armeniaca]
MGGWLRLRRKQWLIESPSSFLFCSARILQSQPGLCYSPRSIGWTAKKLFVKCSCIPLIWIPFQGRWSLHPRLVFYLGYNLMYGDGNFGEVRICPRVSLAPLLLLNLSLLYLACLANWLAFLVGYFAMIRSSS